MVAVNHFLMAPMLHLAHGHSLRESGLLSFPSLSTDVVLAMLGVATAAFWHGNPWLIPFAVAPLLLIHRSLSVPQAPGGGARRREDGALQRASLRHRAERGADPGRPLRAAARPRDGRPRPSARHQQHVRPPRRRRRPAGHRRGLPRASCATTTCRPASAARSSRSCCRRRQPEQAFEIAERIRRQVAMRSFDVETSSEPIQATVSIGVAGFPRDGSDANELIHQADLAVYRAKLQGRNRVLDASSEPLLLPGEAPGAPRRRARGGRARRAAPAGADDHARARAPPPAPARAARPALPLALAPARALRRARQRHRRCVRASLGFVFGHSTDWIGLVAVVALVGVGQALALEVDDGSISVSAVGSLAGAALFGAARCAAARDHDLGRRVERAPLAVPLRAVQRRHALARLARGRRRLHRGLRRQPRQRRLRHRGRGGRRDLLRRSTWACSASSLAIEGHERWGASCTSASPGCDRTTSSTASSAGSSGSATTGPPLGAGRVRGAAAADAQDAGGLPPAHAEKRAEAARRRPRRSRPRTSRSSRRTSCCASARRRRWRASRPRSTRATPTRPATRGASSSSRWRSAASSGSRRRSSTCSGTRRSSTTSASSRSRTRSCSSRRA